MQAQARELHQLLEISSDLSSSGDLEHFLQAFVIRAADFLGFGRCFIALLEGGEFRVRYGVDQGQPRRLDLIFPEGPATQALRDKEVYWTDEAGKAPGSNLSAITQYKIRQDLGVMFDRVKDHLLGILRV